MNNKIKTLITLVASFVFSTMSHSSENKIELDLEETGAPINPFIYGQFIEHLGRCIYGGIWAEMLEDRKFYFPVMEDYDPYKRLQDTGFPVVGASPWEIIGPIDGVVMVSEHSFVGEHTPLVTAGSGIRQHDLALESGMEYEGYIWIRNNHSKGSKVRVILEANVDGTGAQEIDFVTNGNAYQKYSYIFESSIDSGTATLSIEVTEGAVNIGTLSLMPADNIKGMRADTIALLRELNAPIYRWPGGNFVSGYNWRDGIGDRDRRPPRKNPAWTGVEHNDFGTDEFIEFCRQIDTEPTIAVNTGFGDDYTAAQWVEYCNAGLDTVGGSWRIENGNNEPYNVKYWCIGNEMWGAWQLGFMQLHHYVQKNNLIVDAMRAVDPDLELIAVGAVDQINKNHDPQAAKAERLWSVGMLEDCSNHMTYLSEHFYAGRTPWSKGPELPTVEHVKLLKEQILRISSEHRRLQPTINELAGRTMPIAMDEWNYWHRDYQYGELGCVYDLKDALGTVAGLHEFYRQSDLIQIANYAQTVNVIGCVKTTRTDAEFASTGIALKLYRAEWQKIPVLIKGDFGDLDVSASKSDNGNILTISVMNPTDDNTNLDLSVSGIHLPENATRWIITGSHHRAHNVPGQSRQVDASKESSVDISSGLSVPALSSVLYKIVL